MERYLYPHTIDNGGGEKITFVKYVKDETGGYLEVENVVQPNSGPPMHVHLKQAESLTIVKGSMGVQVLGEEEQFYGAGQTATFEAGVPHRFWNAGDDELHVSGWIDPAENVVFYLSSLYSALNRGENKQPEMFDGAYLLCRYHREYDAPEIPGFVKKVIMPVVYFIGQLTGKYKKFKNAPKPF